MELEVDIVNVVLVLYTYITQELWTHEGFNKD